MHAQAGWEEYPANHRHVFAEWTGNNNGSWWRWESYGVPSNWVDSYHNFATLYNSWAPGVYSFQYDGGTFYHTTSDFVPNDDQIYGETHSAADQMPGGINNPEDFNNEHVWVPGSGWINADLYPFRDSTWYNLAKYSSTHFQIGD